MFEKLKQLKDLRSQAKNIQSALSGVMINEERNGIKITMDGNMNVKTITLEKEMSKEELEKRLPDIFNETIKKAQRAMAEKMKGMGGIPGLG
ncbi:MAG: YbaB/EbfC family nucleoid-associated protein [Patescibacteria group bacterium]|jgi:DNA-binding protein YbaB